MDVCVCVEAQRDWALNARLMGFLAPRSKGSRLSSQEDQDETDLLKLV